MFGIGIFEVLVILIVAIIALGPNKLPQTIIDIVKFFRAVKKTMAEAKDTFDKEIQLSEIKQEALKYKQTLSNEVNKLTQDIKLDELREIRTDSITKPFEDALNDTKASLQSTLDNLNSPLEQSSITQANPSHISESSQNPSLDSEPSQTHNTPSTAQANSQELELSYGETSYRELSYRNSSSQDISPTPLATPISESSPSQTQNPAHTNTQYKG